jgi:hypothetical protein
VYSCVFGQQNPMTVISAGNLAISDLGHHDMKPDGIWWVAKTFLGVLILRHIVNTSSNVNMLDVWSVLRSDRFHPGVTFFINSDIENSVRPVDQGAIVHAAPVWLKLIKILCTPEIGQYVLFVIKQGLNFALVSTFATMRQSSHNYDNTIMLFFITMTANVIM